MRVLPWYAALPPRRKPFCGRRRLVFGIVKDLPRGLPKFEVLARENSNWFRLLGRHGWTGVVSCTCDELPSNSFILDKIQPIEIQDQSSECLLCLGRLP